MPTVFVSLPLWGRHTREMVRDSQLVCPHVSPCRSASDGHRIVPQHITTTDVNKVTHIMAFMRFSPISIRGDPSGGSADYTSAFFGWPWVTWYCFNA